MPLPIDDLRDFMLSISPTKEKKLWMTKSNDFLKYYQNYIDAVCGEDPIIRWYRFKELLMDRSHNNSLQY